MGNPLFLVFAENKQIIRQQRISGLQKRSREAGFTIAGIAEEPHRFTVHDHYCGVGRFDAPLKQRKRKDLPKQMSVKRFRVGSSMREADNPTAVGRNEELEKAPVTDVGGVIAQPRVAVPCWILLPDPSLLRGVLEPLRRPLQKLDVELGNVSLHNCWK